MNRPDEDYYLVAVYWPKDGSYGCGDRFKTLEEAQEAAQRDLKLGYGLSERHPIHITRVRRELIEVVTMDEEAAAKKRAAEKEERAKTLAKQRKPRLPSSGAG